MPHTQQIAALARLTTSQLRHKYAQLFGDTTNARNKQWLIKRIAWRLQMLAEGDLSERAKKRAEELANDADLRIVTPRQHTPVTTASHTTGTPEHDHRLPPPGSILVRDYKGRRVEVMVLANGFQFEGETYKSLSAVAKAVTGQHCNGYLFFRLANKGAKS